MESGNPTPVNKKLTPGNSYENTSMNGIDPPHPTYKGTLSLPKTDLFAEFKLSFNEIGRSGASKPSPESIHSNSIIAPNVSSPYYVNFYFKVSTTFLLDKYGGILIEHLSFISLYITFPAELIFVGSP